jgi:molybdopterin molybdotransferase
VFGRLPRVAAAASDDAARWQYFSGLPGNPVSTEVCFHLFVVVVLRALSGRSDLAPRFTQAAVTEAFDGKPNLVRFLPALVESDIHGVRVRPVAWQGSGDVAANAAANGYCVVEPGGLKPGDTARVLLR